MSPKKTTPEPKPTPNERVGTPDAAPVIDTPEKLAAMVDTGKLPATCTTCGNVVGSGLTCEVDGTVAP